ncbi:MAG TPA: GreA/GreB family elongation factor [Verrucomicrobiae bacterium]|jgi:transcription elongation GreA/GreB family factor|nr:GreA/GreB family elongation factor [Verrucomicrobiae bacterium]
MSRAFVKDDDDRPEEPIPVPERGPYYVFAPDLATLDDSLRDRAEIVQTKPGIVGFGARVTVADDAGKTHEYTLVNDEEADPLHAHIGMTSPLAQALLGKSVGQNGLWKRPVGATRLKIEKIEY